MKVLMCMTNGYRKCSVSREGEKRVGAREKAHERYGYSVHHEPASISRNQPNSTRGVSSFLRSSSLRAQARSNRRRRRPTRPLQDAHVPFYPHHGVSGFSRIELLWFLPFVFLLPSFCFAQYKKDSRDKGGMFVCSDQQERILPQLAHDVAPVDRL